MTPEDFKKKTGRKPIQDDLDRVNCLDVGAVGHSNCGWCDNCDKPKFECFCEPYSAFIKTDGGKIYWVTDKELVEYFYRVNEEYKRLLARLEVKVGNLLEYGEVLRRQQRYSPLVNSFEMFDSYLLGETPAYWETMTEDEWTGWEEKMIKLEKALDNHLSFGWGKIIKNRLDRLTKLVYDVNNKAID